MWNELSNDSDMPNKKKIFITFFLVDRRSIRRMRIEKEQD